MKRAIMYGMLIVVLLIAWRAAHYYSTELSPVVWHAQHGFHAEVNGIRLRVPLAYEVLESPGLPTIMMIRQSAHLWHGGGMIDINFHKPPSPEAIQLMESMGVGRKAIIGEQTATLAGRPGKCVEGIPQFGNPGLDEAIRKSNVLEIDCWFGGEVEVTFQGTPNLKDEFYAVVRDAEPVQRKR
jgi:hypothetical protein